MSTIIFTYFFLKVNMNFIVSDERKEKKFITFNTSSSGIHFMEECRYEMIQYDT